jgi:hypothetical protein
VLCLLGLPFLLGCGVGLTQLHSEPGTLKHVLLAGFIGIMALLLSWCVWNPDRPLSQGTQRAIIRAFSLCLLLLAAPFLLVFVIGIASVERPRSDFVPFVLVSGLIATGLGWLAHSLWYSGRIPLWFCRGVVLLLGVVVPVSATIAMLAGWVQGDLDDWFLLAIYGALTLGSRNFIAQLWGQGRQSS